MILIELFDQEHMENIVAFLRLKPEEVFFLGNEEKMQPFLERYRALLAHKKIPTKLRPQNVNLDDMESIVRTLREILDTCESCVIDITGGDERLVMAAGAALAQLSPQRRDKVTVQRFVMPDGEVVDYDGDGEVFSGKPEVLTAGELIALYGGTIYPTTMQPAETYTPADVDFLWQILKTDPRGWNRLLSTLRELEKPVDDERNEFYIRRDVQKFQEKWALVEPFLKKLHKHKVISYTAKGEELRYRYHDTLLQHCLQKEGNLLEVKTLLEARALREKGKAYFDDCKMSVNIDWDGKVSENPRAFSGTHNEIDVILTRGMKALFVSCKNGDVGDGEMYKLRSVAEEFGSPYARKMLIVAKLDNEEAMARRAADMGIYLVKNAADLHKDGWEYIFKEAMK